MSQTVLFEATPNPQAMKFIVTDRQICDETVEFQNADKALRSPLARKIFGFPWAKSVMVGPHFVTITKQDWVSWEILAEPLANLIEEHLQQGEPVLLAPITTDGATPITSGSDDEDASDSPTVRLIKQVIHQEIRPAVAMDGGDVAFYKYESGRVYIEMKGSCSGCPSASMTLKEGIEARLKEAVPEIIEVLSI